eukprot:5795411-Prymnesium_polylepis.1
MHRATLPDPTTLLAAPNAPPSARQTTISSRLIIAALCHTFESACRHARLSGVECRSCRRSRASRASLSASCELQIP